MDIEKRIEELTNIINEEQKRIDKFNKIIDEAKAEIVSLRNENIKECMNKFLSIYGGLWFYNNSIYSSSENCNKFFKVIGDKVYTFDVHRDYINMSNKIIGYSIGVEEGYDVVLGFYELYLYNYISLAGTRCIENIIEEVDKHNKEMMEEMNNGK